MSESPAGPPRSYRKRFYKVGEVAELTGLEDHVLRYWETEFPSLDPRKSRGGQRLYSPADIELILRIKDLLYEQRYTIAGARRRLAQEHGRVEGNVLDDVRGTIDAILTMMEANDKL